MTQRDQQQSPAALTGATGDLTPPEADEDFVPGERRAIEDDRQHGAVISAMHQEADRHRSQRDDPGQQDALAPNQRDGGYGSEHGLNRDDPLYAMDEASPRRPTPPPSETGSDVKADPQADRM